MRKFMDDSRTLYRSRNGAILGVVRGIGEYFHLSVFWLRFFIVVAFFMSGVWPVVALYFIAALVMKPEPVRPIENEDEREFYDSYVNSRRGAAGRLKRRFDNIERRIRRMEDTVTSREFEWDQKFNG